jgi:hypothetical protein
MRHNHLSLLGFLALIPAACFNPREPLIVSADDSGTGDPTSGSSPTGVDSTAASSTPGDTSGDATTAPAETGTGSEDPTESTGEPGVTQIRLVHAAPGAGDLDVYLAGTFEPIATALSYGGASAYVEVPSGATAFDFRTAGDSSDSPPISTTSAVELERDAEINAIVAGLVDEGGDAGLRVLAATKPSETPAAGTARVRFVHAGADLPVLDIDIDNDDSAEIQDLARFDASHPAGLEVSAGEAITVGLRDGAERITQFTLPPLAAGASATIAVTGIVGTVPRGPTALSALTLLSDGPLPLQLQDPRVYLLHAFPSVSTDDLDACEDDVVLADHLVWSDVEESMKWFQVAPGPHEITLREEDAGCTGSSRFGPASTGTLEAGEQYLAVAGRDEANMGTLIVTAESFSWDSTVPVLFGVHAAYIGDIFIGFTNANDDVYPLMMALDSTDISGEIPLAEEGLLEFGVSVVNDGPEFPGFAKAEVLIGEDTRTWLVVAGNGASLGTGSLTALRFRVIDSSNYPAAWTVSEAVLNPV